MSKTKAKLGLQTKEAAGAKQRVRNAPSVEWINKRNNDTFFTNQNV
jgi:hypothetical protein